jgi:hypothetical protein
MDDLSISNGTNLGSNPATLIGNQSIEQIQQENDSQYTALADLISTYAPASVGTQNLQDGSVTDAKIANLTFGKAFGGTITLGGNNNGSGIIKVEDSSNNLIIQEDNLGLHLYNSSEIETIRLDNLGLHAYNTSGDQLILLNDLGLHNYNTSGTLLAELTANGLEIYGNATSSSSSSLSFYNTPGGTLEGVMGYSSTNGMVVVSTSKLALLADTGNISFECVTGGAEIQLQSGGNIFLQPGSGQTVNLYGFPIAINASTVITNNGSQAQIVSGGFTKTAIVSTSDGYRALYTNESPEVWFFDFCKGKRKWWKFWTKEYEIFPDPLFLETIEGEIIVIPTGTRNIVQIWGHRRGFKNIRFQEKTEKQFNKNNTFWNTPNI